MWPLVLTCGMKKKTECRSKLFSKYDLVHEPPGGSEAGVQLPIVFFTDLVHLRLEFRIG